MKLVKNIKIIVPFVITMPEPQPFGDQTIPATPGLL